MSRTQEINYPPEEIFRTIGVERPNLEHVILWMLKNNDVVEWSNFKEEPVNIPQSTLSYYLKGLISDEFIQKVERGVYRITSKGAERYNQLSKAKDGERKLNYPPKVITNERNYDHWILWMVYNNTFCKWSDFIEEPLRINQSSLSKNLNELQKSEIIRKENKEYRITQKGKSEYSRILKLYDLDRQSILNEESKRIEEITKKTITFFEKYNIKDGDIKFRFLTNVLKLPYATLKGSLDSEEDFNKVLLFLSMNHPNQYPFYISTEEFSKKYNINLLELKFNIRQIVEKNVYTTKFFGLKADKEKFYYFQANEKIEKILSAITEEHVTALTYLNKLYGTTPNRTPSMRLDHIINCILDELCESLFNSELRDALRDFLPEYINYLAYRIETERKLVDTLDKLEGVAWRDIPEVFQAYNPNFNLVEQAEFKYYIDYSILMVLPLFSSPRIKKMFEDAKFLMKQKKDSEKALNRINSKIESDPDNLDLLFLKALILAISNRHKSAINFLKETFEDYPNRRDEEFYIPYNYIKIYCHLTLAQFDEALVISNKLRNVFPDHPVSFITRALTLGYKIVYQVDSEKTRVDEVLRNIDQAIELEDIPTNKSKYLHFKSFILNQLNKFEDALEAIDTAIELDPKDLHIHWMKYNILHDSDRMDEALELVDEDIELFPEHKTKLLTHKSFLYKKMNRYNEGSKIVNELWEQNEEDHHLLNHKLYWHLYRGEKEEAIEAGRLLIKLDPNDGNYYDSYGEALTEFGEYEEAIKILKKALEIEPLGWFTYNTYIQLAKCYKEIGEFELARDSLQPGERAIHTCFCDVKIREEWKEKKLKLLAEMDELEKKS
ncbi:MAG: tetratricopeptide repeat protein [Candidatus Thorarchaeota archaeon]